MKIWSRRTAQLKNENISKILPQVFKAEFFKFFIHILGNATTSYFHSEISWPLKPPSAFINFAYFPAIPLFFKPQRLLESLEYSKNHTVWNLTCLTRYQNSKNTCCQKYKCKEKRIRDKNQKMEVFAINRNLIVFKKIRELLFRPGRNFSNLVGTR